jgi:CHAD domain-containing protein
MAKPPKTKWSPRSGAAVNARRHLPQLVADYFAEARHLLLEVSTPAGLHRLRLISKRLRYTLELFRPCYPPGLAERLEALKRLQDVLGDINDAVITAGLIAEMPGAVRMRARLQELAVRKADEFRTEWHTRFDAPGSESWWIDFLSSAAPARKQTARSR